MTSTTLADLAGKEALSIVTDDYDGTYDDFIALLESAIDMDTRLSSDITLRSPYNYADLSDVLDIATRLRDHNLALFTAIYHHDKITA